MTSKSTPSPTSPTRVLAEPRVLPCHRGPGGWLAPLLASLLVLLPFFLTRVWGDVAYSYYSAVPGHGQPVWLGAFLGRISRQNLWIAGLKMALRVLLRWCWGI